MKKALILALSLSLVLSLAACGSSAPGEDVSSDFARAQEAAAALESVHMDMDMNISFAISGGGQSVEMPMTMAMSMDSITEPMVCDSTISMNMFGAEFAARNYIEQDGESYVSYSSADNGATWTPQEMAESDLGRFDATGSIGFYVDIASNGFTLSGTEELDGVKALRYDGAVSGEQLNEAMALTGADEMLSAATDVQGATFEGSMPMSIWLDSESFLPLRYDMDMSEIMSAYMQASLGETEGVTVDVVTAAVSIRLSNFNCIDSIARPEGIA